ncbi:MAP kinase kinase kinase SSK2 [Tolypocladium ophioglossoides CBS 100239]|uniref:mitogen-activated protein kinase n=1 Tax=Tolypocladium ophioglossoides (strain CBS 100239) TaxID=1163406 RepID=A0A0L0MYH6_TOLOC|nr:MAP kinase kinase kinase SSK2 [Tolypocladium ophioglossoides CBS 100239]
MTRLHTAKRPLFQEAKGLRELIRTGAFGKVFKTVDRASGHSFAVKVVDLKAHGNIELTRAALHKEVKALERLSHGNIIECLGTEDWHTDSPQIFMPLREGSLASLAKAENRPFSHDSPCEQALE